MNTIGNNLGLAFGSSPDLSLHMRSQYLIPAETSDYSPNREGQSVVETAAKNLRYTIRSTRRESIKGVEDMLFTESLLLKYFIQKSTLC